MENKYAFTIEGAPDYSMLNVQVPANQAIMVEAQAMAAMDTNMKMKTKIKGGFGRMLGGESLTINEFTAEHAGAEIKISPNLPGDLAHFYIDNGQEIYVQNSCFLASNTQVQTDSKWGGVKGFFSGMGLFLLKCSGQGDLWFNSFGGLIEMEIANSSYIVDTAHIVAFTSGLDYHIRKVGSYKSLFFSGEGLVCEFKGTGKIWIQSRKLMPLVGWVEPYRRVKKKNNN